MNLQSYTKPSVYVPTVIVSGTPDGLLLAERPRQANKTPLIYSDYNEQSDTYTATLTPFQTHRIGSIILSELGLNLPLSNLTINSTKGHAWIGFSLLPSVMKGNTICPRFYSGLSILFVSGINIAFQWQVGESRVKWPMWLLPKI